MRIQSLAGTEVSEMYNSTTPAAGSQLPAVHHGAGTAGLGVWSVLMAGVLYTWCCVCVCGVLLTTPIFTGKETEVQSM